MAYTGTYEQELRKNPTDYKLRAMGKRKYELRRREDGKVTISTKGEPKKREDFRSDKNAIESERKSRKRTKSIFDAVKKVKEEQKSKEQKSSQKEAESKKEEKKSNRVPAKRKAYEDSKNSYLAIDRQTRSKEKDSKKRKDVDIPSQALENLATGVAGFSLLAGGYGIKKFKEAKNRQKLQTAVNKIKDLPKDQQKEVGKRIGEKMAEKMKNAKPSLKQKIKTRLAKLKQKLASGLKSKLTAKTGGSRTGAPAGMGVGGTPFGGKDFDGRRKKTIF